MSQDFESDFQRAARRLKQKERKILIQRFGIVLLIVGLIVGLSYSIINSGVFSIVSSSLKSKNILFVLMVPILLLGFIAYILRSRIQLNRLEIRRNKNYLKARYPNIFKYAWVISLLLGLLLIQANTKLIVSPINDFITRQKYQPAPAAIKSPWPWASHTTIHPAIAGITPDIEQSIQSVAQYIAKQEPNPYLQVKALHDYVLSRVTYDLNVLKTGIRPSQDAQTVFKTHKAVCEGYANLFKELGNAINLETVLVGGKIRRDLAPLDLIPTTFRLLNSDYDWTLHAWNAVKIAGNWYLVDTTWDDSDSDQRSASYSSDYLMPDPEVMIKSHLPEQSAWQLLVHSKNETAFEKQPILTPQFFTESLDMISPQEYPATVQNHALIEIKHPANYKNAIAAFFEADQKSASLFSRLFELQPFAEEKGTNDMQQCQFRNQTPDRVELSCQFPKSGHYQVYLYSLEREQNQRGKVNPLGQLRFQVQ
jgi:hypothetical protein